MKNSVSVQSMNWFPLVVLIFSIICLEFSCVRSFQCHEAFSCANATLKSNQSIECYGTSSCRNAVSLQIVETDHEYIECFGGFSCFGSSKMTVSGESEIECAGLLSCAFVGEISTSIDGYVRCHAELSCFSSLIKLVSGMNAPTRMTCNGFRSCGNSSIYLIGTEAEITFRGEEAAKNTLVYTNGSNTTSGISDNYFLITFSGVKVSLNATVICNEHDNCEIVCQGYGCEGLEIICNDCNNVSIICDDAAKGDVCQTGTSMRLRVSFRFFFWCFFMLVLFYFWILFCFRGFFCFFFWCKDIRGRYHLG